MTRAETNLLLYIETRAVDHGGIIDMEMVNKGEVETLAAWNTSGYIRFGRIKFKDIEKRGCTNWVILSDLAWRDAHEARRDRALRHLPEAANQ